jgi:hypothetical protein
MTIDELIRLAQNRLSFLNQQKGDAVSRGDVAAILKAEDEISETQNTIELLQSLVT